MVAFLSLLIIYIGVAVALPVDEADARATAEAWWNNRQHGVRSAASSLYLQAVMPRAYLFRADKAFLLVATNDDDPTILGYGSYAHADTLPTPLRIFLQKASSAKYYPPQGAEWRAVAPLLSTTRHQYSPYNNACPFYTSDDGTISSEHCVVGCVATAMEQIFTYYQREYVLADTLHGWHTAHYDIADILPGTCVDSRLILDKYDASSASIESMDAVARLSYYLGVAAHMQWGLSESGAYSSALVEPLKQAFSFPYVNYLDSYQYDPTAFWNYLSAEIMAGRPVYYAGSIMRGGGHAFVLDGLDADGLFHVNWGYGGDYDGYYRLDVLAHTQPEANRKTDYTEVGFFCNQEAITLCPDAVENIEMPDTLSRTGHEVVIDKVSIAQQPLTGCATQVDLIVHNEANRTLTTPFALLLGESTDTALIEQADFAAYTGCTLSAGQRDTLHVHAIFTQAGQGVLRITPDGEQVIYSQDMDVAEGGTRDISTDLPQITVLNATTAVAHETFSNTSATERAAEFFEYDILDNATQASRSIIHYIYLPPNESTTEDVTFSGLTAGRSYTLRIRRYWPIVQTVDFTMPSAESILQPTIESTPTEWYSIDGRRIASLSRRGVYLKKEGNAVHKIIISSPR